DHRRRNFCQFKECNSPRQIECSCEAALSDRSRGDKAGRNSQQHSQSGRSRPPSPLLDSTQLRRPRSPYSMKDKDKERSARLLSLWTQRPDGKRTENDVVVFYREMEHRFPQLLNRRIGDPYQDLRGVLKGHIEEHKKV